jgi:hypothetical protein
VNPIIEGDLHLIQGDVPVSPQFITRVEIHPQLPTTERDQLIRDLHGDHIPVVLSDRIPAPV